MRLPLELSGCRCPSGNADAQRRRAQRCDRDQIMVGADRNVEWCRAAGYSLTGVGETASRIVVNTIILIGNPDGTFQTQVQYAAGFIPVWVTTGRRPPKSKQQVKYRNPQGNGKI
jgi:hypothetical protein